MKKKFVDVSMRVSYREKDDTVTITSTDPGLKREGFLVTLNAGSFSDRVLRGLLEREGVLKSDGVSLPDRAVWPLEATSKASRVPLGVTDKKKSELVWDVDVNPVLHVMGGAGTGKTSLINTLFAHCVKHSDEWSVMMSAMEHSHEYAYMNNFPELAWRKDEPVLFSKIVEKEYNGPDNSQVAKLLHAACQELESRHKANTDALESGTPIPVVKNLMVIIDRYDFIFQENWVVNEMLTTLIENGEEHHIYVVLSGHDNDYSGELEEFVRFLNFHDSLNVVFHILIETTVFPRLLLGKDFWETRLLLMSRRNQGFGVAYNSVLDSLTPFQEYTVSTDDSSASRPEFKKFKGVPMLKLISKPS